GVYARSAALPKIRRAVRPPGNGPIVTWPLPEVGRCRKLARVSVIRMRRAHENGDDPGIVAPFEEALAAARLLALQPTPIDHVAACSIVQLPPRELPQEMAARPMEPPVLRGLLAAMDQQLPLAPTAIAVDGQRLAALDSLERVHGPDGRLIPAALEALNTDP